MNTSTRTFERTIDELAPPGPLNISVPVVRGARRAAKRATAPRNLKREP